MAFKSYLLYVTRNGIATITVSRLQMSCHSCVRLQLASELNVRAIANGLEGSTRFRYTTIRPTIAELYNVPFVVAVFSKTLYS